LGVKGKKSAKRTKPPKGKRPGRASKRKAAKRDKQGARRAPLRNRGTAEPLVLSLIIKGYPKAEILEALAEKGIAAEEAARLMGEACLKVRLASEWERDEQTGLMLIRLNEIYDEARMRGFLKEALAAQKELNRVLGLAKTAGETDSAGKSENAEAELEAVRGYLEPLGLAAEGTAVSELARLAVARLAVPGTPSRPEQGSPESGAKA
jgi:hypothetical protein